LIAVMFEDVIVQNEPAEKSYRLQFFVT